MPDYQGNFSPLEIAIAEDYNAWFDRWLAALVASSPTTPEAPK